MLRYRTARLPAQRLQRLTDLALLSVSDEQKPRVSSGAASNRERPPAQSSTGERKPRAEHATSAVHTSAKEELYRGLTFFCSCTLYTLSAATVLRECLKASTFPKRGNNLMAKTPLYKGTPYSKPPCEFYVCSPLKINKSIFQEIAGANSQGSSLKPRGKGRGKEDTAVRSPAW